MPVCDGMVKYLPIHMDKAKAVEYNVKSGIMPITR